MTDRSLFRPVIHFDSVTSTMDVLAALARDGATSGTTVVADVQTGGRGRSGRSWAAPRGTALLMSVLLRPPGPIATWGPFALLTGLAVARAIDTHGDGRCEIKWPNDVLIGGRKVAGVLIAAREGGAPGSSALIAGIGINVTTDASGLPSRATSVMQHTGRSVSPRDLLDDVGIALAELYAEFCQGSIRDPLEEIHQRLAFRGQYVVVEDGSRRLQGWVRGVGHDGSLLLEALDGTTVAVRSGELTRGPVPVPV